MLFASLDVNSNDTYSATQMHNTDLSTISKIMDKSRISNIVVKLKPNQLPKITFPAIAHCQAGNQSYFVVLQSLQSNQMTYLQEGKGLVVEVLETFAEKWSGTVMLLAPDENAGEPNYAQNKKTERRAQLEQWLMWGCIVLIIGTSIEASNRLNGGGNVLALLLQVLYAAGAWVSVLLLQSEYGQAAAWVEKLCSGAVGKAGCGAVTQSAAGKVWGVGWAEIGLVYFGGGFLSFLIPEARATLLPLLSLAALLYVPFSLYYQAFVVRAWCVLCLVVQGINVAIAGLWYGYNGSIFGFYWGGFSWLLALHFLAPFGVLIAFWLILKPIWQQAQQLPSTQRELALYKQDSALFLSHLYAQPPVQMDTLPNETQIGNVDAPVVVVMVSNPHCKPCQDAHEELTGWVRYFEDEMQLRIRHINSGDAQYQTHEDWAQEFGIAYTPTLFINGRQLPSPYTVKDIWQHVRALSEKIPA